MKDVRTADRVSFGTQLQMPFDDVVLAVREALAVEGFGVLSVIDVAATLADRLDEFMSPYVILGACNPSLASWAIRTYPSIGVLLPCNVVVRENPDGVVVDFMDPEAVLELIDDPEIVQLAAEAKTRLTRVCDSLGDESGRDSR